MPSPRRVTAAARTRDCAVGRLTKECAVIIAIVRAFFERERRAGRASGLHRVVQRTVDATGVSERTVRRVAEQGHANRLPGGGEAPTRTSPRRIPPEELARARAAVYAQYENRSIPTLDSTLAYLQTEAVVLSWSPSSSLKDLVAKEFDKITPEVWAKYEDHAIKMEDFYRGWAAACDADEGELEGREQEMECVEEDEVNADDEGSESEEDERTDGGSEGMDDEEEG